MKHDQSQSVLALYPTTRGYAFVLFESESNPIDWGVRDIRAPFKARNVAAMKDIEALVDRVRPDCIVIEDTSETGSRRSTRIQRLHRSIVHIAQSLTIDVRMFGRGDVRKTFASVGAVSRYEVAQAVAREFPALGCRLPRKRKIWESERSVMGVFAAAALGLTFYSVGNAGMNNPPLL